MCTRFKVSESKISLEMSQESKIAKAGPRYDVWPEHPSVQINSSRPWFSIFLQKLLHKCVFALLSISFFVAFLEFM